MTQIAKQNQETKTLLSLTNDAVLKLYFTKEENIEQLKQFLKAATHLTDDDLAIVQIKNSVLTKEHVLDKDFIVDIRLTSTSGHQINIEMQMRNHDAFIDQMVSYNARQFASQLSRGENYTNLKEVISLIIVDFEMFDDTDDFCEHILFRRKNRKIFTKAQQFYIIDLTKLPKELTETKHKWGALFKSKTEEGLKMLMEESEEMRIAGEKLLKLSEDECAQEIARARADSQWAWNYTLRATEERARKEGCEEAREEAREKSEADKLEIAKSLLRANMPIEEISKHVKISVEKVEELTLKGGSRYESN